MALAETLTVVRDVAQILTPVGLIVGAGWRYMAGFKRDIYEKFDDVNERIDSLTEQVRQTNGSVRELKVRADHSEKEMDEFRALCRDRHGNRK